MATSLKELQHDQQKRVATIERAKAERVKREAADRHDWELYCADPEGARQRHKAELRRSEAATEIAYLNRQQQATDRSAFWAEVDQRIAEAVAAQYTFTTDQQELLFKILKDERDATRGQISKAIEEARRAIDARFETLERRVRAPGALPPVKVWRQGAVTYEGELTSFNGELYQARMDTGLEPGDPEAWICVARAGKDAAQVTPRGGWRASGEYGLLDLVTANGCSYLATRNDPGEPGSDGSGWQMVAAKGAKGDPGLRGDRGARGAAEAPVTISAWSVNVEEYRVCPVLSNGQIGAALDLRVLFAQFGHETGTA
jgi:hypothetical protein